MSEIFAAIGANIEIIHVVLFALGIIFLIVEMFEPGFGLFGGIGIVLMIIDVFVLAKNVAQGIVLFAIVGLVLLLFVIIMMTLASNGIIPKKLLLKETEVTAESFAPMPEIEVGAEGVTVTYLRPSGKAKINGKVYDVVSDGEFIPADNEIIVLSVKTNKITVKLKNE